MIRKKFAAALAAKSFNIFRLRPNDKKPYAGGWQKEAKPDGKAWANGKDYNIGVATGSGLLVVDIDMKEFDGEANWTALGIKESPFQVKTPSGGRHLYYETDVDVSNSASSICDGVDIRGLGGYVVGPGSELDGVAYKVITIGAQMLKAPDGLIAICNKAKVREDEHDIPVGDLDTPENIKSAKKYLDQHAHISIEGSGGDATAFGVAARVRDMGISETKCLEMLMIEAGWNDRCEPPWDINELEVKVGNAYKYSSSKIGRDTAEAQFADEPDSGPVVKRTLSAMERFYQRFSYIAIGTSHVIGEEYIGPNGRPRFTTYGEKTFHGMTVADYFIDDDDKKVYISRAWIMSEKRRTYRGFTFDPQVIGPVHGKYNHWRGFTHQPIYGMTLEDAKDGCDKYLKHIRDVVCGGDIKSYKWVINHFAHLIQYPWKKPETAIVVTGKKGVGKSLIFDVIGALMRDNYIVTAEKRMLLGQFNSHMESALAFQFEEAFWAGDKAAEGKLKHVITGKDHAIERKGYEPYMVRNFARIYITSNNAWAIPATVDERRFGVFACLALMCGDKAYFKAIYDQLEGEDNHGFKCLMTALSLMDVDQTLVHVPPKTQALADQKEETLDIEAKWLHECLMEGAISGAQTGFEDGELWPVDVLCQDLYEIYRDYSRDHGFRYSQSGRAFGRRLNDMLGSNVTRSRLMRNNKRQYFYVFSELEYCREGFEKWFGHKIEWD
tara:strand:+ start:2227 stop:4395 length:2169 start_codon:yes stop_codon:yes gene_type:complete